MDNFYRHFTDTFGGTMPDKFEQSALYFDCMDYVEYITEDTTCVAERVDEHLTVLWDSRQDEMIGFRIKGFKHLFNTRLKSMFDLSDHDFLPMISVIQAVVGLVGDEWLQDARRQRLYKKAFKLAHQSRTGLSDVPFCLEEAA